MISTEVLMEIMGWVGAIEVVAAYFLVSFNILTPSSVKYQLLNLTGAVLLIINTVYLHAYPSASVNVIWVGIAAFSLLKKKEKTEDTKAEREEVLSELKAEAKS